jgi:hypothetical protein
MSLRFFYARAECGDVCMGRLGLVGLMGSEKDLIRIAIARSAGAEARAERNSSLLSPLSSLLCPLCIPCVSVFIPLSLPNKKIAQANRLRWLTCAT